MKSRSEQLGRPYREKELRTDAARAVGLSDPDDLITQQGLNQLTGSRKGSSKHTPALAAALGVRAIWLQYGYGSHSLIDEDENNSGTQPPRR
ncbi:MAG: hypothetical protein ACRD3Q_20410 [Terriglobales bacterium]